MFSRAAIGLCVAVLAFTSAAADPTVRYYTCPVSRLQITDGTLPLPRYGNGVVQGERINIWPERQTHPPTFSVKWDGATESELIIEGGSGGVDWRFVHLAVRTTEPGIPTGRFEVVDEEKKTAVSFRLPPDANTVRAAAWFQYAKANRINHVYRELLRDPDRPGQAWFRHRIREAAELRDEPLRFLWRTSSDPHSLQGQQGHAPLEPDPGWVHRITIDDWGSANPWRWRNRVEYAELVSGNRAIAENLQLDRNLRVEQNLKNLERVKLDTLKGLTIRPYDWKPHIAGLRPTFDPLASLIPADQHAVFFPDTASAVSVLDEIDRSGFSAFSFAAERSVDDRIIDRYMKQLALPRGPLGKLVPSSLVNGVAVTGSDLYFDTGSDVAVLLATNRPEALRQLLTTAQSPLRSENPDASEGEEKIGETKCHVLRTPDRRICVYTCEVPGALLLTNSSAQVRRIAGRAKDIPTIDSLHEYIFFRDRYRRGEADETAFAILSDDAIRRWCGPRWRIGHQRRIRTGALLADAQAKYLKNLVAGEQPRTVDESGLGPVTIGPRVVNSASLGNRVFQTPIAEVEIDEVSTAEADAYQRWRDSYQQNWSQYFDPIAVRLTVQKNRLAADLSVMPLIASTDYRDMLAISTGAKLTAAAGDPHPEAIAHLAIGLNRKSEEFAKQIGQLNHLIDDKIGIETWIGDWFTIYADDDPVWKDYVKATDRYWEYWDKHKWRIPVGVAVGVRDSVKLAAFLLALKATIDKHAPNLVQWNSKNHHDIGYLEASAKVGGTNGIHIFSLPLPDMWLLTLDERIVHRAIDRHLERKDGKQPASAGWLGDCVGFTARPEAAMHLRDWWSRSALSSMQQAAWLNLPILNEWHTLNAKVDPVSSHEQWWHERLVCPAGGRYVWNDADGTIESQLFGHPDRPKTPNDFLPAVLKSIRGGQFGLTFERDGLRARVDINRE